jgi:hypothetical protein
MDSTYKSPRHLPFAPLGGLIGALLGGALWAKYIQWTGLTAGWIALAIGIFTGIGVLLVGRSRQISISLVAALFAVVGILLGKYLDVQWNAPQTVTVAIIEKHDAPSDESEGIGKMVETRESGLSVWRLMRQRMEWIDLLFYVVSAYIAFRVSYSRRLYHFFFRTG